MFNLFRHSHLLEATSLSRFVRDTSSAEKKRIYANVISKASLEQRLLMESVAANKGDHESKQGTSTHDAA